MWAREAEDRALHLCVLYVPERREVQALGPHSTNKKTEAPGKDGCRATYLASSWLPQLPDPTLPGQGSFWEASGPGACVTTTSGS